MALTPDSIFIDKLETSENPVIVGYSFMGLYLNDNDSSEIYYNKYYLPVKYLCVNDVCKAYNDKVIFIKALKNKLNRLKAYRKLNKKDYIFDEEMEVIKEEKKIINEQKLNKN